MSSVHKLTFDPGGENVTNVCYFGEEDIVRELQLWSLDYYKYRTPKSIRSGVLKVGNFSIDLQTILFDTGAIHRSYVNSCLIDAHRLNWASHIKPTRSKIRLGDQRTVVESTEELHGNIFFQSVSGQEVSASINFVSHSMPGMDVILGLPDIVNNFVPLLTEMLQTPSEASDVNLLDDEVLDSYVYNLYHQAQNTNNIPVGYYEWSIPDGEEGEEEANTVEPSNFAAALLFMETSFEDALKTYKNDIPKHIGPLLRTCKRIKDILESELAINVFVPRTWEGIRGFEPIDIEFNADFPKEHKVKSRPINPRLFANVKKEILRLLCYMYKKGLSPWASPLVVAPKATEPFIRMCGDYRWLNQYIALLQAYIPNVQKEILKVAGHKYFLDFDLTNSFHQMIISEETSKRLALSTPFGQILPMFMPEGVKIASGWLQKMMMEVFKECEDWTVVIFDNLLVLANTEEEAVDRLIKILSICKERNIILKLSKTWLGFESVKFFGYKIQHNKYEMDSERKDAILKFSMPKSVKEMQRFLGTALFFKSFVPNFSAKCHLLHEMTKVKFNWKPESWSHDYVGAFNNLKNELADSIAIHFPDYDLKWTLRVDASDHAVGAVLFQERIGEDKTPVNEVIGVASKKFSDVALKWDAFKKEGYGMYYGVQFFSYFLRGKPFILETDHRNLLWIEKSDVPIVVRWRVYLQSFHIYVKHIPGTKNVVADCLSRMYYVSTMEGFEEEEFQASGLAMLLNSMIEDIMSDGDTINALEQEEEKEVTPEELLSKVHGGRNLHKGARRTWKALNTFFPGHKVSFKFVQEYVERCPICQKDRLGMIDTLKPIYRHIKPEHQRSRVGVDRLTVTPADDQGNDTAIVIVEHFTKFVAVYPDKRYDGESIARALMRFFATYGLFDELISDPGSDIMSKVVSQLNKWLGIRHVVSLVDWHQSNGVERTNQELLKHLKTLVHDERILNKWSDPMVLSLVVFSINDAVNSETGCRAFDLKFGSEDGPYLKLPAVDTVPERAERWLMELNEDLRAIRAKSKKYQAEIIAERVATTPQREQNQYQPGDMVLFQLDPDKPRKTKLSSPYLGPFEVKRQYKNDVEVQHMSTGAIHTFHVTRLKLFIGTVEEAKRLAQLDGDQFVIKKIHAWQGDPDKRSTTSFKVEFEDGDVVWLPFSKDLDGSIPFGEYIMEVPMLLPLRHKAKDYNRYKKEVDDKVLDIVVGSYFYMDIRYYGVQWYDQLTIPDKYDKVYVVRCNYEGFGNKKATRVKVRVLVFDELLRLWNFLYTKMYGGYQDRFLESMVLVDKEFVRKYPEVAPSSSK